MLEKYYEAPESLVGKLFRFNWNYDFDALDSFIEFYTAKPIDRLPYTWEDSFRTINPCSFLVVGFEYTDFKEEANLLLFHVLLEDGREGWFSDFWLDAWIELKEESE